MSVRVPLGKSKQIPGEVFNQICLFLDIKEKYNIHCVCETWFTFFQKTQAGLLSLVDGPYPTLPDIVKKKYFRI